MEGLPSIVAEEKTSGGDKETDHDGRRRRACDIVGLLPAHGYCHGCVGRTVNPGLSRRFARENRSSGQGVDVRVR